LIEEKEKLFDVAIQHFQESLGLKKLPETYLSLSYCYFCQDKLDQAIEIAVDHNINRSTDFYSETLD